MRAYLLKRIGYFFLTLVLTSLMVFIIAQIIPGDVCRVILGRSAGAGIMAQCAEELGLNDPYHVRYIEWLSGFMTGNWGQSYSTGFEIYPLVMGRLGMSVMLAGVTMAIAIPLSLALGIISGLNQGKLLDNLINFFILSVVGLPEFVTGIVLINWVGQKVEWIPPNSSIPLGTPFWEALPSLILPSAASMLVLLAYISRLTRAGIIEELKKDYVRTALLKGLGRRTVILRHVLRNALMPAITVIAISVGWLISGLIVIENVFNYPGLGRLMVFAIDRRDLPVLQAAVMVTVVGYVASNLAADILYAVLNPRIRIGGK
ncbi:MAG: ABC transporter permease [Anaerolineae bacterium]|nr:ABC transporter permease [Anaerolineae bacterium]